MIEDHDQHWHDTRRWKPGKGKRLVDVDMLDALDARIMAEIEHCAHGVPVFRICDECIVAGGFIDAPSSDRHRIWSGILWTAFALIAAGIIVVMVRG